MVNTGIRRPLNNDEDPSLFLSDGIDKPWLLRSLKVNTVLIIVFTVLALGDFISTFHLFQILGIMEMERK
jgi:hypothetical protein